MKPVGIEGDGLIPGESTVQPPLDDGPSYRMARVGSGRSSLTVGLHTSTASATLMRPRAIEQEVLDLLDEPTTR